MKPFPEDWEFLSLFECEPELSEPDLPWYYNHLKFDSTRGTDRFICEIEPAGRTFSFKWFDHCVQRLSLQTRGVENISITTGGEIESIEVTFLGNDVLPLHLQFLPFVSCQWGTDTLV